MTDFFPVTLAVFEPESRFTSCPLPYFTGTRAISVFVHTGNVHGV
jgi:hypothetical protein